MPISPPDRLGRSRRSDIPGVAEALYRDPNPQDGGDASQLTRVHPDWHLGHPRADDLLLVAAPGYVLAEDGGDEVRPKGNHGAPGARRAGRRDRRGGVHAVDRCDDVTAADARGRTLSGLCAGMSADDGERR
ncbi:MAG: hypothetical protein HY271_07865 [Deltaproteobacteria bacterium]|nr:hypothetical protein [Deltaproteobacteria bacterium]